MASCVKCSYLTKAKKGVQQSINKNSLQATESEMTYSVISDKKRAGKEEELLERTLKLFKHGVSHYAFKMCATAVSQILRKVKGTAR